LKIIHLSDIHIGKSKNHKRFSSIVEWILNNKAIHKAIVITGDIVDDGALWQYKVAKTHIDRLRDGDMSVFCVPGNHDYGKNGIFENMECIGYFKKYISRDVDYPHCEMIENHAFVLLDSMLEEMKETEFLGAQGKLGEDQLRNLDKLLDDIEDSSRETKVIVTLHHHTFYYNYFLKLRDDDLFKKVITREKDGTSRINCVMFGHKHVENRFNDLNDSKEEKYGIDVVFASGSTTERHSSGKMVVPVIDLSKNEIAKYEIV
jgi:3',5'-cyclic AMP phosphodiesterase CpdA